MGKLYKFVRGQIWCWSDPLFGSKNERKIVPYGEGTMRYTRYVLIIQNMETVDETKGILVIPLSTKLHNQYNIPLDVSAISSVNTYIHVNDIMPVSCDQLIEYKGMIDDDTMIEVEHKLLSLIIPGYTNDDKPIESTQMEELSVSSIPEPSVVISNEDSKLSEKKVRAAYHRWTTDEIKEFLQFYNANGVAKTANKYGLAEDGIYGKVYKFRKKLSSNNISLEEFKSAISKLSNDIDNALKKDIYTISLVSSLADRWGTSEDDVFNQINSIIYFSIVDYFNIDEKITALPKFSNNINKAFDFVMAKFRNSTLINDIGFDKKLFSIIREKLQRRMHLNDDEINIITKVCKKHTK